MAPSIEFSPEVLARLRALGGDGDRPADQVLRLLLGLPEARPPGDAGESGGCVDATYGVRFPEGFEIFRTYKGRAFRARAEDGGWRLDADGRLYDSLNQLSRAVIDGNENAWMFWHYRGPDGRPRRIAELRDPAKVQRRPRKRPASTPAPAKPTPPPAQPEPAAAPATPAPAQPEPAAKSPAGTGMAWQPRPAPLVQTRPRKR